MNGYDGPRGHDYDDAGEFFTDVSAYFRAEQWQYRKWYLKAWHWLRGVTMDEWSK